MGSVSSRFARVESLVLNSPSARATTAMPLFFDPFTNPRTMETYLDGALNHNNPVMVAAQESKLLWPDLANHPPDILLSLGNGQDDEELEFFPFPIELDSCESQTTREDESSITQNQHTVFKTENLDLSLEALRVMKRAFDSSKAESVWKEFGKDLSKTPMSERFIRVNPRTKHKLPRIDDMTQVDGMQKAVEESLCTSQSENQIKMIARRLIASSFYFEQLGPLKLHEGNVMLEGRFYAPYSHDYY